MINSLLLKVNYSWHLFNMDEEGRILNNFWPFFLFIIIYFLDLFPPSIMDNSTFVHPSLSTLQQKEQPPPLLGDCARVGGCSIEGAKVKRKLADEWAVGKMS